MRLGGEQLASHASQVGRVLLVMALVVVVLLMLMLTLLLLRQVVDGRAGELTRHGLEGR